MYNPFMDKLSEYIGTSQKYILRCFANSNDCRKSHALHYGLSSTAKAGNFVFYDGLDGIFYLIH